ncbi:MAG: HAMP domain-containing protein [Deltaproteobacteria bacterium]|nr:MAG: HAMP domain-containing protein [Deltaproteobacteria bacterium]
MSRAVIGGIVAVIIAALTAVAYLATTSKLEAGIVDDVQSRVLNAQDLLVQNASLEGLGLLKRAEVLARDDEYLAALNMDAPFDRENTANAQFRRFLASLDEGEPRPDFLALVDKTGDLVALLDVARPPPDSWKDKDGNLLYPAVKVALEQRTTVSDVWNYTQLKQMMKVGVAPIIDDVDEVAGAIVIAYALTAKEARLQRGLLGLDVAYFYGDTVHATSFVDSTSREDVGRRKQLQDAIFKTGLVEKAMERGVADDVVRLELGGEQYIATVGRLPRFASKKLPADYPPYRAGAVVLMSLTKELAPLGAVRTAIGLLGVGAILVAIVAIVLTARSILAPLDQIELGINEIINGNTDKTFSPAGSDLDGLANALNVMLARLLGRPEPGDEQYDENGNVVTAGGMAFDTEGLDVKDAEALQLAAEPEPDYYKRIYAEYVEARKAAGDSVDGVTYEGFVAKLRLTEANLKKKYNSRAVRFRVVTKDGKVTLKPVPIA